MTTKELVEAVEEARRKDFAEAAETFGRHAEAAVSALGAHALALEAELAEVREAAVGYRAAVWRHLEENGLDDVCISDESTRREMGAASKELDTALRARNAKETR